MITCKYGSLKAGLQTVSKGFGQMLQQTHQVSLLLPGSMTQDAQMCSKYKGRCFKLCSSLCLLLTHIVYKQAAPALCLPLAPHIRQASPTSIRVLPWEPAPLQALVQGQVQRANRMDLHTGYNVGTTCSLSHLMVCRNTRRAAASISAQSLVHVQAPLGRVPLVALLKQGAQGHCIGQACDYAGGQGNVELQHQRQLHSSSTKGHHHP